MSYNCKYFYNTLILPLFDYGDVIWRDKNNETIMLELQILRIKLLKFCWGTHPNWKLINRSTEEFRSQVTLDKKVFFIVALQSTSAWLGKLTLTLILSKIKLSIHITQDVPMIFVYPFLELTGVNKHLSIKLQKTGTVFQLISKKHISYLLLNPSWKLF